MLNQGWVHALVIVTVPVYFLCPRFGVGPRLILLKQASRIEREQLLNLGSKLSGCHFCFNCGYNDLSPAMYDFQAGTAYQSRVRAPFFSPPLSAALF